MARGSEPGGRTVGALALWVLCASAGCAIDRSGLAPEADAAGRRRDAGVDAPARMRCGGSEDCGPDEVCALGACVPRAGDRDADGVPTERDCDDADASVGTTAERACDGPCGGGLERCTDAVWGACDAPTSCDCVPGTTRSIPCPMCGAQAQRCDGAGTWQDDGPCAPGGVCAPGAMDTGSVCGLCGVEQRTCSEACAWEVTACAGEGSCAASTSEMESQDCGMCGTQSRTRVCNPLCGWDPWGAWSACAGEGACAPFAMETDTQGCGAMCGTQTRTRTCGATCAWGAWTPWGACAGAGACVPGTTETRMAACGCGTRTEARTCSATCTWGGWAATSSCADDDYCRDRYTNRVCVGNQGLVWSDCASTRVRRCTCERDSDSGTGGAWGSCTSCYWP